MTDKEKEHFESYREVNWGVLIVWLFIAVISFLFGITVLYGAGYVLGEYIIPFLQETTLPVGKMFWLLLLFIIAYWLFSSMYKDICESEEDYDN